MKVDLRDQPHVRGANVARDFLAAEAHALVVLAVGTDDRMLVGGPVLGSKRDGAGVMPAEQLVERRRCEIGPVRLDVGEVQHPWRISAGADPVEREVRHVRGLGMALLDARRQVRVAQVPAGDHAAPV